MALLSIEVRLAWLISKSVHRRADRRLNELENMLANLAKLSRPIDPATELRISSATRDQLIAWVTANEPPTGDLVRRLEAYAGEAVLISSELARDGWISLYLA
jgi:hypothetical protein